MRPKRYPYRGQKKKQSRDEITIEVNTLKADVTSIASRMNQFLESHIIGI